MSLTACIDLKVKILYIENSFHISRWTIFKVGVSQLLMTRWSYLLWTTVRWTEHTKPQGRVRVALTLHQRITSGDQVKQCAICLAFLSLPLVLSDHSLALSWSSSCPQVPSSSPRPRRPLSAPGHCELFSKWGSTNCSSRSHPTWLDQPIKTFLQFALQFVI